MSENEIFSEEGQKAKIAVEHRMAVMKTGKLIWFLIFALSAWGIYSAQYRLILVALFAGFVSMWLLSIQAANKVEKLTGLTHEAQAAIWKEFKRQLRGNSESDL